MTRSFARTASRLAQSTVTDLRGLTVSSTARGPGSLTSLPPGRMNAADRVLVRIELPGKLPGGVHARVTARAVRVASRHLGL